MVLDFETWFPDVRKFAGLTDVKNFQAQLYQFSP
jgi:hypothetical protein